LSLSSCLCMSFTENTNSDPPGDWFDYLKWGHQSCTCILVVVVPWLTSFFNRAGLQQPQLLWFDGGAPLFQPHVEWSILDELRGKPHALPSWTPLNSVSSFAWAYLVDAHTYVIHILHVLWGLQVVALLKPLRDSGTQAGPPLIY
jgi:hypothetical protein